MVALFFATDTSEMHLGRFKIATDNVGRKGHTFQPGLKVPGSSQVGVNFSIPRLGPGFVFFFFKPISGPGLIFISYRDRCGF